MLPTNDLHAFARYKVVRTFRPDGATIVATRVVEDINRPVYWDVDEKSPQPKFFVPLVLEVNKPPSTSQLIKGAQEAGYGNWNPVPEDAEPDTTDYLVD